MAEYIGVNFGLTLYLLHKISPTKINCMNIWLQNKIIWKLQETDFKNVFLSFFL